MNNDDQSPIRALEQEALLKAQADAHLAYLRIVEEYLAEKCKERK